jgi:hypothetical protein
MLFLYNIQVPVSKNKKSTRKTNKKRHKRPNDEIITSPSDATSLRHRKLKNNPQENYSRGNNSSVDAPPKESLQEHSPISTTSDKSIDNRVCDEDSPHDSGESYSEDFDQVSGEQTENSEYGSDEEDLHDDDDPEYHVDDVGPELDQGSSDGSQSADESQDDTSSEIHEDIEKVDDTIDQNSVRKEELCSGDSLDSDINMQNTHNASLESHTNSPGAKNVRKRTVRKDN